MEPTMLAQRIAQAPRTPGVYTWRDARRRPLYIGKASDLKARLSSYPKTTDSRIRLMIEGAATLTWQTTDTDIEALILESQLIKDRHPKYNIDLRDDKQYFFVGFTHDKFPRIFLTHQPLQAPSLPGRQAGSKLQADFIGPFTEGVPLKTALRTLRNLFPTCSCTQKHHLRCLNAHIGKCPGYCCLKAPATNAQKAAYRRNIAAVRDVLTGKRDALVRRLARQMPDVALRLLRVFQNAQINARHHRMAARHSGALAQLQELLGLTDEPHRIEGYDIANIQGEYRVGAMVVFTDGRAHNQGYRLFNIRTTTGGDTAMLSEVLRRRLGHPEWPLPDLVIVDGGKAQLNAARQALKNTPVVAIQKDEQHRPKYLLSSSQALKLSSLPRSVRDLLMHVDEEAHRFAISHYRKRHGRMFKK